MPEGQELPQQEPTKDTNKETSRTLAERHPDWPKIKLKFYFSAHGTTEDMADVKKQLTDTDVYLYENITGDQPTKVFQKLANADPETLPPNYLDDFIKDKQLSDTPVEAEVRALYGSKKIIGHIDLRPGDPITPQEFYDAWKAYSGSNFNETLQNLKQTLKIQNELHEQRERIITERFEEELEEIFTTNPELKDKTDLKVLATMGAAHTTLAHKLREKGVDVDTTFSQMPYSYSYENQAQREFAYGKEPNHDILAKAYLESVINSGIERTVTDKITSTDIHDLYLRQIASNFTTQEIEGIYDRTRNGLTVEIFDDLLRSKGLDPLPRTDAELKSVVEKQKKTHLKLRQLKASSQQRRPLPKISH